VSEDRAPIRISITPEPTEEELAAIVSALTVVLAETEPAPPEEPLVRSRWATAGRHEAMRGIDRETERW
jgi:hypothetical protein